MDFFNIKERGSSVKTEILAGVTVFFMTCYIFALNPAVLSQAGIPAAAAFAATGIASVLSMVLMGAWANIPLVMSGGMGLNAFLVYTVCLSMGYPYQTGLAALLIAGVLFCLLSFFKVRDKIVDTLPPSLKSAVSAGIGLFIAFIGAKGCGWVAADKATFIALGRFDTPEGVTALIGLIITLAMQARGMRGAFLTGVLTATVAGVFLGTTVVPENFTLVALPSLPLFCDFSLRGVSGIDLFFICFTFLFLNVFDTLGTLLAVCSQGKLLQKDGSVPKAGRAFFCAGAATAIGAVLGTTVTGFVESVSMVIEGAKTGLSTLVAAALFAVALFFSPLFLAVPFCAVSPVLVVIGFFMMSSLKNVDFSDVSEGFPAFACVAGMAFTFSIVNGIVFGLLAHVFCCTAAGRARQIGWCGWCLSALCLLKFFL